MATAWLRLFDTKKQEWTLRTEPATPALAKLNCWFPISEQKAHELIAEKEKRDRNRALRVTSGAGTGTEAEQKMAAAAELASSTTEDGPGELADLDAEDGLHALTRNQLWTIIENEDLPVKRLIKTEDCIKAIRAARAAKAGQPVAEAGVTPAVP